MKHHHFKFPAGFLTEAYLQSRLLGLHSGAETHEVLLSLGLKNSPDTALEKQTRTTVSEPRISTHTAEEQEQQAMTLRAG